MKKIIIVLAFFTFSLSQCFTQTANSNDKPETLTELKSSIQRILKDTKTPGAGVVMVSGDKTILLEGFGKADIENDIDVNENTLFRLGSVSKLFVGLAILKLQEEGRLNLKDKVRDIIHDLKIINQWEDKHPIRIENLLEHTAGLRDWSLAELGCNNPKLKTLKESLEYYPKGRIAVYAPGTRTQYSNLGVSIAAYIVEKVSGMPYENYIDTFFFKPMGITDMSFSNSDKYKKIGAKGYDNGNLLPFLYPLYRPSAALIGSPKDISKLLNFFINRGKMNDVQIISDSSLQRMERGESLDISKSDIFNDYIGLTNYISRYNGFEYHGYGGHVPGSNADFCYLPKNNFGYAIMINDDNENTIDILSDLIKEYQTKDLPQELIKAKKTIQNSKLDLSGYYIPVNYKFDFIKFFQKIKRLQKFWNKDDTLYVKSILNANSTTKYIPIGNGEFRSVNYNRIGFIQVNDPVKGQVIYGSVGMLKKISPIYAYTLLVIFWAFFIIPITIFIFSILRLFVFLFSNDKNKTALWICLWPFITISSLLLIVVALKMSIQTNIDYFLLLGNISPLSILIFICTICFALASLWSIYYILKNRHVKMSRIFYYHSIFAAIFNFIFTIYFFSNGIIGIMTWI